MMTRDDLIIVGLLGQFVFNVCVVYWLFFYDPGKLRRVRREKWLRDLGFEDAAPNDESEGR